MSDLTKDAVRYSILKISNCKAIYDLKMTFFHFECDDVDIKSLCVVEYTFRIFFCFP